MYPYKSDNEFLMCPNKGDTAVMGDLKDALVLCRLTEEASQKDLDVLIHCAGVYENSPFYSGKDFEEIIEINLLIPMRLTRSIWPIFERRRSGLIVFINSLAGKQGGDGETAYSASKHGLAGFARALQFDAAKIGVRVLSVFLGAMKTDMTRHRPDWDRLIDPQEAARAIVSLCEDYPTLGLREVEIGRTIY